MKDKTKYSLSRLKGPPPALEGPLAANTRLQKGRRLFTGKLHGPESFTADEEGGFAGLTYTSLDGCHLWPHPLLAPPFRICVCLCVFQVMCTQEQLMGSCGGSVLMTVSPSSHRWDRIYLNVVCVVFYFPFSCFLDVHQYQTSKLKYIIIYRHLCLLCRKQHRLRAGVWPSSRRSSWSSWSADSCWLILGAAQCRPQNWREDCSPGQLGG